MAREEMRLERCWLLAAFSAAAIGCGGKTSLEALNSKGDGGGGSAGARAHSGDASGGAPTAPSQDASAKPGRPGGSCSATFCRQVNGYPGCCIGVNGPCGARVGADCLPSDRVPPEQRPLGCDLASCAADGFGMPCCTPGGTCSMDTGFGCGVGACGAPVDECFREVPCSCVCSECQCEWLACMKTPGCAPILDCALRTGCAGSACYASDTCAEVIDAEGGPAGTAVNTILELDTCVNSHSCGGICRTL